MDSDFNHQPKDVKKIIEVFEKKNVEIVCGSRFVSGGSSNKIHRHILSLIFNKLVNFILNGKIQDNLSGFFVIKKNCILKLDLKNIFYGYGDYYIRLLYYCQKKKYIFHELGVVYGNRKNGYSKSKFLNMFFKYLFETIKIKFK